MTWSYDTKQGRLCTALTLSFTVVPKVLRSGEFWFFLILHLTVFSAYHLGFIADTVTTGKHNFALDWDFVKVVTAMTTFFEVFYSNQCYGRYIGLYKSTRSMLEDAHSFATIVRTHVGEKSRSHARLTVRYMSAALLIAFSEMKSNDPEAALSELLRLDLLKPEEAAPIRKVCPNHRRAVLMGWSSLAASAGCIEAKAANNMPGLLSTSLEKIRAQQQEILDTTALPVPFHYFHLLSIMIIMNLSLWAYRMGLTDSVFAPVVFFFAALIFIGMMELSSELSDPFGSDEVDFPVDTWLAETLRLVTEVCEVEFPGGRDGLALAAQKELPMPRVVQDLTIMRQPSAVRLQRLQSLQSAQSAAAEEQLSARSNGEQLSARDSTPLLSGSSGRPADQAQELAELGRSSAPPGPGERKATLLGGGAADRKSVN